MLGYVLGENPPSLWFMGLFIKSGRILLLIN